MRDGFAALIWSCKSRTPLHLLASQPFIVFNASPITINLHFTAGENPLTSSSPMLGIILQRKYDKLFYSHKGGQFYHDINRIDVYCTLIVRFEVDIVPFFVCLLLFLCFVKIMFYFLNCIFFWSRQRQKKVLLCSRDFALCLLFVTKF